MKSYDIRKMSLASVVWYEVKQHQVFLLTLALTVILSYDVVTRLG